MRIWNSSGFFFYIRSFLFFKIKKEEIGKKHCKIRVRIKEKRREKKKKK